MNRSIMVALFVWAAASEASAVPPYRPYVDPTQLDCPWPKHSDYKQPWRAYLQTKPAVDFLAGIGVNWASPGNDQLAVRLLAEAGFKAMRIEIGWGSVKWDESGIHNQDRMLRLLKVTSRKLVIAVYVMTYDVTKPMQEQQYQLAIRGLPAGTSPQTLYDPITGDGLALQATREGDTVEVTVPVLDYPRLMVVE